MYKPFIAALIAATALATPALAQDRHHGDRGGDRGGNGGQNQASGNQGHGQWRQDAGQARGNWRGSQPAAQPAAQPQPQVQQQQYRRQWNGGGQQQAQQQQAQVQQRQPAQFRGNRGGNGGVVPQQYRGNQGRGGYQGRGNTGYRSSGGGNWQNGWRHDNRYDWRGYRNSNRNAFHLPRYYPPRGYGYGYNRFSIGLTIGSLLYSNQYWIDDPWSYRLPDAYGPYRWVRYYNDALLVDIETGEVVDVEYDIFW